MLTIPPSLLPTIYQPTLTWIIIENVLLLSLFTPYIILLVKEAELSGLQLRVVFAKSNLKCYR